MIKNEQVKADIQEIMKLGTDTHLYVKFATFLNEIDDIPESSEVKDFIAKMAKLIKILEK